MSSLSYPIINISDFMNNHKLKQFHGGGYSNFSHLISAPASDTIYVVSNANEILQLKLSNLVYANKYSMKKPCTQELCEKVKIEIAELQNNLLWFCFAYKSFVGTSISEHPMCYMVYADLTEPKVAQWFGDTYVSNDFQHRSIQLITLDYAFSGLFLHKERELNIFKNPLTFGNGKETKKILLPRYFLKNPGDFITSFQYNHSIYFLYLETDFVCGYKEDRLLTRLLRLCNSDFGNSRYEFSVFGKVGVECKQSNRNRAIPTYKYRVATNGLWLPLSKQLVVTFVNSNEEIESSAICVFSIEMIEKAFNSDLKKSAENPIHQTNRYQNICQEFNNMDRMASSLDDLNTLFKNFPLRRKVLRNEAIYKETGTQFNEIASDESNWSQNKQILLFISAFNKGRTSIFQIILKPDFCISRKFLSGENVTMLKVFNENDKIILYIGTSQRLIKMPMDTCYVYINENLCLIAKDPYCYWNSAMKKCMYISTERAYSLALNSSTFCSRPSEITQQIHSKIWIPCKLLSLTDDSKQIGACSCNIEMAMESRNKKISVSTDCKIDGDWTKFSSWSDCSVTCGTGTQTRSRKCENPRPQRGGSPCKGNELEFRSCATERKCENNFEKAISSWSEWSPCSQTCGFSFQTRTHKCFTEKCTQMQPERRLCDRKPCEYKVYSEWTPWSTFDLITSTKTRLRFQCIRQYQYKPVNVSFKYVMKHDQLPICSSEECHLKYKNQVFKGRLKDWSAWSSCSSSCDNSEWTIRTRSCIDQTCFGATIDHKPCAITPCYSAWNCWSSWKGCSSSCETKGSRTKTRKCRYDKNNSSCEGNYTETSECPLIPCHNSYSKWSEWSFCKRGGIITRTRKCLSKQPCLFPLLQSKPCSEPVRSRPEEYSFIYMIVSGLVGLVLGILIAAIVCYIWWKCTISVITSTYSESMKISNSALPMDVQSIYDSQSLQTLPDTYGTYRRRTSSGTENYSKNPSPNQFIEQSPPIVPLYPYFQMRHPPLLEEHVDTHI